MRIDPVYLVAPKPSPTPQPTRRAFLAVGTTFGIGSLVGGACGYSVGTRRDTPDRPPTESPPSTPATDPAAVPPTNDATLLALRRMAVEAPIADLVANWNPWFMDFSFDYTKDPVLWQGMDRLAQWAVENLAIADLDLLTALAMMSQAEWRGDVTLLRRHIADIQAERRARAKGR
ncbi:MAG: hypothetical protein RL398_636 [Planctomycetota bacterium]